MSCVYVTFLSGVLGRVWCLVVSIPDLSLLPYFRIVDSLVAFSLKCSGKVLCMFFIAAIYTEPKL